MMIYLIRHGETEFNREGRCQGRVDSPLTPLGLAQARAAGERLGKESAAFAGRWRFECSPLGRARRSAEVVAEAAGFAAARVEPALVEVSYGELEGLDQAAVQARGWAPGSGLFGRAPGGETLAEVKARCAAWLEAHQGPDPVAAVTHAGVIRTLRGLYLGLVDEAIWALDKPQDVVFRLQAGRIDRLECPPLSPSLVQR